LKEPKSNDLGFSTIRSLCLLRAAVRDTKFFLLLYIISKIIERLF
jgi:hypothetical protein